MAASSQVRVRIAPSPTGFLHVGTARTALFNYLFAKKHGGIFVLRIEDTDVERSEKKYENDIFESLTWLGLDWDEGPIPPKAENYQLPITNYRGAYGPYRQSERIDIYEKYLNQLLRDRHAYYCFCTKEELTAMRELAAAEGKAPRYNGTCRALTDAEVAEKQKRGLASVIRFKVPEREVSFTDLVRGKISFDMALTGDAVIAKDTRTPLYNFAVVVDDSAMEISHVIRGEDHIANTPKQILFQEALGFSHPYYAHIPLILDEKRAKLSKRNMAASVGEYRAMGYLPGALFNFLALLGWHPEGDQEIMTKDELIAAFDLSRVQKGGAVFSLEKLDWINNQYLRAKDPNELLTILKQDFGVMSNGLSDAQLIALIKLMRDRMKTLSEFTALTDFFFALPEYAPALLTWKQTPPESTFRNLREIYDALVPLHPVQWKRESLERILETLAAKHGKGEVFWPLRAALSGKEMSPGPVDIMEILGKTESVKRVTTAIEKLEKAI